MLSKTVLKLKIGPREAEIQAVKFASRFIKIKRDATLTAYISAFRGRIFKCNTILERIFDPLSLLFIQLECQSFRFRIASVQTYVVFEPFEGN